LPKRSFDMQVGTTPVCVLPANPKRLSYSIVNNGTATIFLGADQGVTIDSGEPLPAGAMVSDDRDKENVYAISPIANQDVRITELLEP